MPDDETTESIAEKLRQPWSVASVRYEGHGGDITLTLRGERGGTRTHTIKPGMTVETVASSDPWVLQHFTVNAVVAEASASCHIDAADPNNVTITLYGDSDQWIGFRQKPVDWTKFRKQLRVFAVKYGLTGLNERLDEIEAEEAGDA